MNIFRSSRRLAAILLLLAASLPGNMIMRSPLIRRFRNRSRGSGPEARRRRQAAGLLALFYGAVAAGGLGPRAVTTASGLQYEVVAEGSGPPARSGQLVAVHQIMKLVNGALVFSTYDVGTPVTFTLGDDQVIAGLDEGVTGMKVGERRRLIIPAALNRGPANWSNAPPDTPLYADVLLMSIQPG